MSHLDDLENGWKKLRKNHKERERLTRKKIRKKNIRKKKLTQKIVGENEKKKKE